jgi:hypothetical protein
MESLKGEGIREVRRKYGSADSSQFAQTLLWLDKSVIRHLGTNPNTSAKRLFKAL